MKRELKFILKVIRNGCVLAGLMFFSSWATDTLNWALVKPLIIFLGFYVCTELAKRYGIDINKSLKERNNLNTIILS